MSRSYTPPHYNVPLMLLIPVYQTVKGVPKKVFPKPENGLLFYGSFKTFGGTETTVNDLYSVLDTANVETWYRPDIKADCRIHVPSTNSTYEVIGEPENIDMRNQYLKFKVKRVAGNA